MVVEGYIEESLRDICGSVDPDIQLDLDDLEAVPAAERAVYLEVCWSSAVRLCAEPIDFAFFALCLMHQCC